MYKSLKETLYVVYFIREVLLLYAVTVLAIVIISKDYGTLITASLGTLILYGIIMRVFYKKRKKEIDTIRNIITGIRTKRFTAPDEIVLDNSLSGLDDEIKLMFQQQLNDLDYLQKLEKMRTHFLGNVSHELKTPIFAVQGFIETLLNGAINDPKVNMVFLEKANLHANNLSTLVNELIDLSMIESGEMRMSFRYIAINGYLQEIVSEFEPIALKKGLAIEFIPAPKDLELFGDKEKIRQVIVNLIQNAIRYTEEGKVTVSVENAGKYGRISVSDTGIGIAKKNLSRIFERFYRVDKARSRSVGGTGLGLAIVKHIIEAHNSKVEVSSTQGAGSRFSFLLKK